MTGRPDTTDPLDRIEELRLDYGDLLALVAVARAARERRDAQIDATHYHQYDPACPCCIAQDKEWAALARLDGAR